MARWLGCGGNGGTVWVITGGTVWVVEGEDTSEGSEGSEGSERTVSLCLSLRPLASRVVVMPPGRA